MARQPTPAPISKATPTNELVIAEDFSAANTLALAHREADTRTRAVALQLGYQLPADCTDPDLIQRDISANMRRSVEACLEVGKGLRVLKEACGHGNFTARLDVLGIDIYVASRFMQSATKFAKLPSNASLTKAIGNQTKLFEMLVLDEDQLEELELTGQTGELALDDIATMSVKELRAALREEKKEREADAAVLAKKTAKIDKLERDLHRIKRLPVDAALALLMKEATGIARNAAGLVEGELRLALNAVNDDPNEAREKVVFMAGLVGQVQAQLSALREEFNLPDVSNAADAALAAEMSQWNQA